MYEIINILLTEQAMASTNSIFKSERTCLLNIADHLNTKK